MIARTLKPKWRIVKFGDVVRQCKESVDRKKNFFDRYIEGGHMNSEDIHIHRWGEFGSDYVGPAFHRIFRKGQVLYGSRRTYLKKVAIADFDGITANTTFVCETKDQNVFMQELLPFLMLTDLFTDHSIRESKGSTNPYINWPDIAKYEFLLPSIDEQKCISEILWAADNVTECSKDTLNKNLFLEKRLLLHLFEESDRWALCKVSEIGDVQLGRQRSPKYTTGKYTKPYLRVINVLDGKLDFSDVEEMDFNEKDFERYCLKCGDILITEGDIISPYNVGRNAIYGDQIRECCFQNTLIRLRCYEGINPEYVSTCLRYMRYRGKFAGVANTTTVSHLGGTRFANMRIPIPPTFQQSKIVDQIKRAQKQTTQIENHLVQSKALLTSLRESLLSQAGTVENLNEVKEAANGF